MNKQCGGNQRAPPSISGQTFIYLFIYTFILKNKKKVLQSHNYIRLFTP